MRKILGILTAVVMLFPGLVLAQGNQIVQQRVRETAGDTATSLTQGNQIQNQNQVQNQGEEVQLQNQQQQALRDMGTNAPEAAVQRRSQVATALQAILQLAEKNEEIGPQVREIARVQNQNQERLELALEKLQSRSALARFFVGPDYGQIGETQKILEQNRLKLQELNQIRTQLTNQADQQNLVLQIQLLEQVNTQFQNALNKSAGGFSLFGWMFRLFGR